jgi:hypothetical protein
VRATGDEWLLSGEPPGELLALAPAPPRHQPVSPRRAAKSRRHEAQPRRREAEPPISAGS